MLHRYIARPLSHTISTSASPSPACAACICRCGNVFRRQAPPSLAVQQRRTTTRKSPATWDRIKRMKARPRTPKTEQATQAFEKWWEADALAQFKHFRSINEIRTEPANCVAFLAEMRELPTSGSTGGIFEPERFQALVAKFQMSEYELFITSVMLLRSKDLEVRRWGSDLLRTLSRRGLAEATIRILVHAWLQSKTSPGVLRMAEIVSARGRLREIARDGRNYRAMVLEGKIAREVGDDNHAIECWTRATHAAVAAERERTSAGDKFRQTFLDGLSQGHYDDAGLSSPWIELTMVYYERYKKLFKRGETTKALHEYEKARSAMLTGCEQDDPTSHYHSAVYFHNNDDRFYSGAWLYHMTKAAASGHVKATHSIAKYYAESGWKYIEDEPPDHLKPTPFDSYPVTAAEKPVTNLTAVLDFLGLGKAMPTQAEDSVFHSAAFPSTPQQRFDLAIYWADIGRHFLYLPSYLLLVEMYLTPALWVQAYVPPHALKLTPERYTYASKADYDADRPIINAEAPKRPDEPNKKYNPKTAKMYVQQIFLALQAYSLRAQLVAKKSARRKPDALDDEIDDAGLQPSVKDNLRKWTSIVDLVEMNEVELPEIDRKTRLICEEQQWDIYGKDGGLLYRHGLMKPAAEPKRA